MPKNLLVVKKLNITAVLTISLLALMLAGGFVSGIWGFALGREALKGVSQPDARPTAKKNQKESQIVSKPLVFLKEADIIKTVKVKMQEKSKPTKEEKEKQENKAAEAKPSPKAEATPKPTQTGFPITVKDKGVVLEIRTARRQESALVLDVTLKNEASQPVKFVYRLLDITDNWGRSLSANAENLPEDLPANSDVFSGTVSIPNSVLENAEQLSLTLTDYPNQQIRLQAAGIPVVKPN